MDKYEVNKIKDYVMMSLRFCEQVYEGGFDSYEQFQAFNQMCANHVDMCNTWCKRVKPRLGRLNCKRWKLYMDLRNCCAYTVECMNGWLADWQGMYDKTMEELKFKQQLEERCRLEHQIAIEIKDAVYEADRAADRKPYCGFKTGAMEKPKKKRTNKRKKSNE